VREFQQRHPYRIEFRDGMCVRFSNEECARATLFFEHAKIEDPIIFCEREEEGDASSI
jgi:hypothetical protein